MERELKLGIAEGALPQVLAPSLITALTAAGITAGRLQSKRYHTVYFDDAERSLGRAGIIYRIRYQGRRVIHGVKAPGEAVGGLATRHEWEVDHGADLPALRVFPAGTIDQVLDLDRLEGRLEALFVTRFTRKSRDLVTPAGDHIEWAVDDGAITTPDGRELPIAELELELKHGDPLALFDLALILADRLPLTTLIPSKGERGLRLADQTPPPVVKGERPNLEPEMSTGSAFAAILAGASAQWLANLDAVRAGSVEGIHQMRVALRRLRSALKLLKPLAAPESLALIDDGARQLAAALGAVRDWDVFLSDGVGALFAAAGDQPRLAAVRADAAKARAAAFAALVPLIDGPAHTGLVLSLGRLISSEGWGGPTADQMALAQPLRRFARKALDKAYGRVMKRGAHLAGLPPEELHALRIALKRLRYGGEFFASLYPAKATRAYLSDCAALQDHLGALNDAHVASGMIRRLGSETKDRLFAQGLLLGAEIAGRDQERLALQRAWRRFKDLDPFWLRKE